MKIRILLALQPFQLHKHDTNHEDLVVVLTNKYRRASPCRRPSLTCYCLKDAWCHEEARGISCTLGGSTVVLLTTQTWHVAELRRCPDNTGLARGRHGELGQGQSNKHKSYASDISIAI